MTMDLKLDISINRRNKDSFIQT